MCNEDLQRWADVFRHRTHAQRAVSPNISWDKYFYKTCFVLTVGSNHKRRENVVVDTPAGRVPEFFHVVVSLSDVLVGRSSVWPMRAQSLCCPFRA